MEVNKQERGLESTETEVNIQEKLVPVVQTSERGRKLTRKKRTRGRKGEGTFSPHSPLVFPEYDLSRFSSSERRALPSELLGQADLEVRTGQPHRHDV